MNQPSMMLVRLACACLPSVSRPIEEYTETLVSANDTPVAMNRTLVIQNEDSSGISAQATPTMPRPSIIARR
ncbi:hypothetical protein D3C71_2116680 [compost metagenome]